MNIRVRNALSALNEQAIKISSYTDKAIDLSEQILYHCSYFLLYNAPQTFPHWKKDVYAFVKPLKAMAVKSGDKQEATYVGLMEGPCGKDFCEYQDPETARRLFKDIYGSEDIPHSFDYDMDNPKNQDVYFGAISAFYNEFLIPWIAKTDKFPDPEPLNSAIDKYLVAQQKDFV